MKRLVQNCGAGYRNRTCFVSLKRRVHSRICQSRNLVGDAGIEPAWSRSRVECISHLCQSPVNVFGRRGGSRTHMNLIRNQVPNPFSHTPSYNPVSQCERRIARAVGESAAAKRCGALIGMVQDVGIEPTPRDYRSRARPSS